MYVGVASYAPSFRTMALRFVILSTQRGSCSLHMVGCFPEKYQFAVWVLAADSKHLYIIKSIRQIESWPYIFLTFILYCPTEKFVLSSEL